jgi:hypothetical protein
MAFIKTLTIDDFYTPEGAYNLSLVAKSLSFVQKELGRELENFNHVPDDISEIISNTIARKVLVYSVFQKCLFTLKILNRIKIGYL